MLELHETKSMFTTTGVLHLSRLEKGKTINHYTYINECIKPLFHTINQQRPFLSTKNMKFYHENEWPHVHLSVKRFLEPEQFIIGTF